MPKKPFGLKLTESHADCFSKDGANAGRYTTSADREGVITPEGFKRDQEEQHSNEHPTHPASKQSKSTKTEHTQDFTLSPRSISSDDEGSATNQPPLFRSSKDQNVDMVIDEAEGSSAEGANSLQRGRASSPSGPNNPNAKSKSVSVAQSDDCEGVHNRHPCDSAMQVAPFRVGVSSDKNKKCRRTMEDAHAFVYDYGGVKGQGYFAVFDGHAGKHAAEWCGDNFHLVLLDEMKANAEEAIPDVLNTTFHKVDQELSKMAAKEGTHSGCTAVTAFLRLEDASGKPISNQDADKVSSRLSESAEPSAAISNEQAVDDSPDESSDLQQRKRFGDGVHRDKIKDFFRSSSTSNSDSRSASFSTTSSSATQAPAPVYPKYRKEGIKRTLYTANVGDARAVLCRGGKAVRLTYDHKGSDAQEAKRITDAGGFVMNNRVNGVLAVTRSLGDSSMKEFVVGSPYTTETTLTEEDQYLIIACDGLWDVCEDQEAIDIIASSKDAVDPQEASKALLDFALSRFSSDNLSVMVIALR